MFFHQMLYDFFCAVHIQGGGRRHSGPMSTDANAEDEDAQEKSRGATTVDGHYLPRYV